MSIFIEAELHRVIKEVNNVTQNNSVVSIDWKRNIFIMKSSGGTDKIIIKECMMEPYVKNRIKRFQNFIAMHNAKDSDEIEAFAKINNTLALKGMSMYAKGKGSVKTFEVKEFGKN